MRHGSPPAFVEHPFPFAAQPCLITVTPSDRCFSDHSFFQLTWYQGPLWSTNGRVRGGGPTAVGGEPTALGGHRKYRRQFPLPTYQFKDCHGAMRSSTTAASSRFQGAASDMKGSLEAPLPCMGPRVGECSDYEHRVRGRTHARVQGLRGRASRSASAELVFKGPGQLPVIPLAVLVLDKDFGLWLPLALLPSPALILHILPGCSELTLHFVRRFCLV